jgi:3-dehydroquinate dehydratase/shikimate dehydrogenase
MIELRLDCLSEWALDDVRLLLTKAGTFDGETIVTCRRADEGGHFDRDEQERLRLIQAAASGADYVDLEYEAWRQSDDVRRVFQAIREKSADPSRPKLILSKHDFDRTPDDLEAILDNIASQPADVVKLACTAREITDSLRMLEALRNSSARRPTIALAMGETGVLTRILARPFGAMLTFASLESGKESAPGQVTLADMRALYRWDTIRPSTRIYGVIGCPVAHSMSPAILNAAFGAATADAVYLPMRVEADYESFAAFVDGCLSRPWFDLGGCSVTIPHKQNLMRYVEQHGGFVEPLAARIGAANTLHVESPRRRAAADGGAGSGVAVAAYNTDYRGAMDALCQGIGCESADLGRLSAAVLGAGGVSRAVVAGLRDAGCAVTIYNRTHAKAEALASEFGATARPADQRADHGADIVVNCTSIGMWPDVDATPLPADGLSRQPVVFDTVYNPIETRLLREARARGCRTVDGVAMFVNQAAAQFERWTGRPAPTDVMRDVVLRRLSR